METLHHRLAAVWFADVVGFTRQAAQDEGRALRVVQALQEASRDVVRRYQGRIVKFIGDAALAEFSSTESAVRAAIRLRRACEQHASRAGVECPTLRVAVHVGDVTTTEDGDVYGDGVNLAARIVKEVVPGEVWVSEDVWRQLRQRPRFGFEARGAPELKGVEPVELYAVMGEEGEEEEGAVGRRARAADFLRELRRRNVYRAAVVYAVVGWLVIQVVAATFPILGLPQGLARAVMLLVVVGFPVALALAWAYELTPQGIRRAGSAPAGALSGGSGIARQAAVAAALTGAVVAWIAFGPDRPAAEESGDVTETVLDPSRIAVLYFDDHSENRQLGHLADGLTEGLIHDLAQVAELDVISREGVKIYRDANVPVDSVARALGAGTLVEGSVARSGERVRVTVQLINAADMIHLASIEVERPRGDLFELQDELVQEVSAELRQRLGKEVRLERRRRATSSVEAWELVQRAEGLLEQGRLARDPAVRGSLLQQADSLLQVAQRLDPRWVEPVFLRARQALIAGRPSTTGQPGDSTAIGRGIRYANLALALAPREPRLLGLLGELKYALASQGSDSVRAAQFLNEGEHDLRAALAIDPSQASAWIALADLLYNGKWDLVRALEAARRAYEEDAFLLEQHHYEWLSEIALQLKRYDEAMRWIEEGRRRHPIWLTLLGIEGAVLASHDGPTPDPDKAWRLVTEVENLASPEERSLFGAIMRIQAATVLARAGLRDSAVDVARRARGQVSSPGEQAYLDYYEAHLALVLGQRAPAIALLGSFLTTYPQYRARVARDHWFEALSRDPRFERLVDRRRLPFFCQILCEPPPD